MTDYTTPPPPPPPPPPPGPPGPPGGVPPYDPTGGYGAPPPQQPQNWFGITALVLGILSIPGCCCYAIGSFVLGIPAVILGFLGMKKADAGEATNKPLAMAGLILGAVGILLGVVAVILAIAGHAIDWSKYQNVN